MPHLLACKNKFIQASGAVACRYVVPLVFWTMHRRWTTKRPAAEDWPHRPLVPQETELAEVLVEHAEQVWGDLGVVVQVTGRGGSGELRRASWLRSWWSMLSRCGGGEQVERGCGAMIPYGGEGSGGPGEELQLKRVQGVAPDSEMPAMQRVCRRCDLEIPEGIDG